MKLKMNLKMKNNIDSLNFDKIPLIKKLAIYLFIYLAIAIIIFSVYFIKDFNSEIILNSLFHIFNIFIIPNILTIVIFDFKRKSLIKLPTYWIKLKNGILLFLILTINIRFLIYPLVYLIKNEEVISGINYLDYKYKWQLSSNYWSELFDTCKIILFLLPFWSIINLLHHLIYNPLNKLKLSFQKKKQL